MIVKNKNSLLSVLSGLLLSLSWFPNLTFLIFIAWVPLLFIAQELKNKNEEPRKNKKIFGLGYLTFFCWNILVTWWISHASLGGAAMAILTNALLMSLVFLIFFFIYKKLKSPHSIWILIPVWISFEYLHLDWDLSWPWLNLGNVFAFQPKWIQWYEYTGVSGGSTWILFINLLVFTLISENKTKRFKSWLRVGLGVAIPILLSLIILNTSPFEKNRLKPIEAVIVQPNIDPYSEKFYMDPKLQLSNLLKQIEGKVSASTDLLVLPETFLTENIWENQINESESIKILKDSILSKFPKLSILTGASSLMDYGNKSASKTARKFKNGEGYFDYFNTALFLERKATVKTYHKSKLVPGVEKMPFPSLFKPLESLAIDMGGTIGSLGIQKEREVFENEDKKTCLAPVICYESIYGEYVSEYVNKGANLLCIITNDGWWEDTPGYKQHLAYGCLRAIENRKPIARSANTGVSCFIDEYGNATDLTQWWKEAVIKKTIYPNSYKTFYATTGDWLAKAYLVISIIIIGWAIWLKYSKK